MDKRNVAVIGAGAAGMMAAIAAAENGASVTLYEKNDRVGKKILVTGNGKCNFSNLDMETDHYYVCDGDRLRAYLDRFDVRDTVAFFQSGGLMVKNRNGYLYPASEQASAVLDTLRLCLKSRQVKVLTEQRVMAMEADLTNKKVGIRTDSGRHLFDRAVIACGGKAAPKTGSDGSGYELARKLGHTVNPVVPALVQLKCGGEYMKSVAGVRAEASVRLFADGKETATERGELQLTDYGISGIVVFQMSRVAAYAILHKKRVKAVIDFFPDMGKEEYRLLVQGRKLALSDRTAEEFFTGMLNKKLMLLFMRQAGIRPDAPVDTVEEERLDQVFHMCRGWELSVTGTNSFDQAQVCAGGIPLTEVDGNLQSLKARGIYFAGEILDVDGKCGGYNLQWAWTSGHIAGKGAATL